VGSGFAGRFSKGISKLKECLKKLLIVKQIPSKGKTLTFEIVKKRLQAIKRG